jgi:integrase
MAVNITETAITRAVKQAGEGKKRIELADAGHPGLRLRVTPAGGRSWVLACRDPQGRMRRFPLGNHPKMGLADAREAARIMWVDVRKGADPVEEARRKRAMGRDAKEGVGTLGALIDLYAKKKGKDRKSWPECKRRIESVFARLLKKPIANMNAADIQFEADNWESGQSAAAAVRYLRPILKWASEGARGYAARDLALITPPATVMRRDRILSREELALVLPVLKASPKPYAVCLRFLLLTLARREEACQARWRDVDLTTKTWTIPRPKNNLPHVVPLPRQAIELLKALLPRNEAGEPAEPKPTQLIFATSTGHALGNWDRETKALQTTSKTKGWTRHDLRRTGATMLGNMGHPPHVVEAALNHTSVHSQLAATYNQARYRPEVEVALQRLADALDGIEADGAKILIFPRGKTA